MNDFYMLDNFIRINSFLKSEIFKKLFIKVLYNENFIQNQNFPNGSNNTINNSDIYNIFSLWYMIKEINLLIKQIKENNNDGFFLIDKNINEDLLDCIKSGNIKFNIQNNLFIKHHIFDFIENLVTVSIRFHIMQPGIFHMYACIFITSFSVQKKTFSFIISLVINSQFIN